MSCFVGLDVTMEETAYCARDAGHAGRGRITYNSVRPHSALGNRPPAPEVAMPGPPMLLRRPNPTGSAPPAAALH